MDAFKRMLQRYSNADTSGIKKFFFLNASVSPMPPPETTNERFLVRSYGHGQKSENHIRSRLKIFAYAVCKKRLSYQLCI